MLYKNIKLYYSSKIKKYNFENQKTNICHKHMKHNIRSLQLHYEYCLINLFELIFCFLIFQDRVSL